MTLFKEFLQTEFLKAIKAWSSQTINTEKHCVLACRNCSFYLSFRFHLVSSTTILPPPHPGDWHWLNSLDCVIEKLRNAWATLANYTKKYKAVLDLTLISPQAMTALPECIKMLSVQNNTVDIQHPLPQTGNLDLECRIILHLWWPAFITAFGYCRNFYSRRQ